MVKTTATLGGVKLAAVDTIAWKFVTGVQPYRTIMSAYTTVWGQKLRALRGRKLALEIRDSRGVKFKVSDLYILHRVPSSRPKVTSFIVADKRWRWPYKCVARDYNVPKKTGNRTALATKLPVEVQVTEDQYDYRPYSLRNTELRWTAKEAVKELLDVLEPDDDVVRIDSFPIDDGGQFSLQNVMLQDQGDVALSRMLSYIPGAQVWVDASGKVRVFDGADLRAARAHEGRLPPNQWGGDKAVFVDREKIRPSRVLVHYQRELELLLEYKDDYSTTTRSVNFDSPYLDNVIPTVEPKTTVTLEKDPEVRGDVDKKDVPIGTWLTVDRWLAAMDAIKPEGSLPWTFDTIKRHWLKGDLDGVLGGKGADIDKEGNVSLRIQALKQHFRQTFRLSRRYMERIRNIRAVRAALLDPVTGARAPAAVWGQACVIPTTKGKHMSNRTTPDESYAWRNLDYLAPHKEEGKKIIETSPGPTRVNIIDGDLGIFRLEWIYSPYGTDESFIPCNTVDETGAKRVPRRPMRFQDDDPMGPGMKSETGSNGLFLDNTLEYRVLLTIVPAAPNNKLRFHREIVEARDIAEVFRSEFGIDDGEGPDLELIVPPGELTARYAWFDDGPAAETIEKVLGLEDGDPTKVGFPHGAELPGFVLVNDGAGDKGTRHIRAHAISMAAEAIAPFADSIQGNVLTRVPRGGPTLKGNMSGATVMVAPASSAKVAALHEFPGQQRPISRFSMMPEETRQVVLGILPLGEGGK